MAISEDKIKELKIKAREIRKSVLEMLFEAGSGHTAGPLGMADIFTFLYFYKLKHKPKEPSWKNRDRVILSNGHICPVLYATMAHAGYFPKQELKTLRKFGSRLQGHPHRKFLPYMETSSGPLGSGLSQAIGMAIAEKIYEPYSNKKIYCLMSDGELEEGQNWEAIMLAAKLKLSNLIAIVDRNNIQIDGFTKNIMPLESVTQKWNSFNWNVIEINGNSFKQINQAFDRTTENKDKPTVIIANNTPGKGVSFFENDYHWHGKTPNKKELEEALIELDKEIYE